MEIDLYFSNLLNGEGIELFNVTVTSDGTAAKICFEAVNEFEPVAVPLLMHPSGFRVFDHDGTLRALADALSDVLDALEVENNAVESTLQNMKGGDYSLANMLWEVCAAFAADIEGQEDWSEMYDRSVSFQNPIVGLDLIPRANPFKEVALPAAAKWEFFV